MGTVLRIPGAQIGAAPTPPASALLDGVSAGPLLLLYPGHPDGALEAIPATSGPIMNLAHDLAQATIGSDPGTPVITNGISAGSAKAKAELTSKGGIHVMQSLTAQASPYELFDVGLGGAGALAYLNANPTHDYYLGVWYRVTRAGSYSSNAHFFAGLQKGTPVGVAGDRWLMVGPTNAGVQTYHPTSASGLRSAGTPVERKDGTSAPTYFAGIGTTDAPASFAALNRIIRLGAQASSTLNALSSVVVYRVYLEDLTASGRTAADLAAIDLGEYVEEVLTVGGQYFGDTWSDPAVALP